MPPVALPVLEAIAETPGFQGDQQVLTAYNRLLLLEPHQQDENQVLVRLLGWMLIHAPCPAGRSFVAGGIQDCDNGEKLFELARYYLRYLANGFVITRIRASVTPSTHPSQPDVDAFRDHIMAELLPPPQNHKEAKKQALVRDEYRCLVTQAVDITSYNRSLHLQRTITSHAPGLKRTQCSHIIPSHINRHVNATHDQLNHAATVWTVLGTFGGFDSADLDAEKIHRLDNILTLEVGLHSAFDRLDIWLDPIEGTQDQYTIGRRNALTWPELPQQVTLTSHVPHLPAPNRQYLALHAACAKVMSMSGAAEVIDHILDDYEDMKVLASDGSSAELLEFLLFGNTSAGLVHCHVNELNLTTLLAALRTGDVANIQPFLNDIKPGKKHNPSDNDTSTAEDTAGTLLHFAIRGATYETIELVLSNKYVSPNLVHPPGSSFTAIHLAASLGRTEVLKLLLDQDGADDTTIDDHGQSVLDVAKDQRTLDVIRESQDDFRRQYTVLLSQYINSPNPNSAPATAELLAILKSPRVKLLDLSLLDASTGTTLLHEAARRRDQPLVEAAVHAGADVFVRDRRGKGVLDGDKDKEGERIRAFLRQYLNHDASLVGSITNDPPSYKGYLSKYANVAKGYNTRWFVLKDDMLSYYRSRDDEGLAIRGAVSVRTARIKTIPGDKLRFEVHAHAPSAQTSPSTLTSTSQKWYMKANHPGEVARWTQVLTRSIEFYQQKDRSTLPPPNSDGESVKSNREGSRRSKSLRSSVDMLRGWSGRSTHSSNRSRSDIRLSTTKAESTASHGPPEDVSKSPKDDSQSQSSAESDASHIPYAEQFPLQLHTLQMEIDLAKQLLDELVLPPNSPPRLTEVKSTLQRSILTIQGSVDQYTTMARERESWYANRVQDEADARRMWEENVVTLANQSEQVERELVRSVMINKGQRRVLKSLLESGLNEDPGTPRPTIDSAPLAEQPTPADLATTTSPPPAPERPNALAQITLPETARPPTRSPLAGKLAGLGDDEILGDDESDTDEFFDAIESGIISNVPSAIRPQPDTPLPPSLDTELYRGYKTLRDRLPIGNDNRPPVSLWAVLKGSIGKDLTKISFPVFFNEPTSMLQRMAEDMEYSECLDAAAQEKDAHKRIAYVAAFAMSNYSSTIGRIAKPFNPMLGETFEYCRLDKQYRYVSEQVSHHPPMSACWAESPQWNYYGEVDAKNKFMGKSFEIRPTGVAHADVKLPVAWAPHYPPAQGEPERGQNKVIEHYSWKKVTTNVSGFIVGQPTIDHYGDMTVVNHRTGDTCLLTFKPRGWRAKDSFEIKGTIQDAAGQVTWEIAGRWNSQLLARRAGSDVGDLLPDAQVSPNQLSANQYMMLWKNTEKPPAPFNLTPFAITLNDCPSDTLLPYLPPTDCRIRPDQRAFEMGRYERANELKATQEDFQRATRRKRELGEIPSHNPRWFSEAIDEDSGERVWAPAKKDDRIEYWAERERVFKLGGKDHAQWDAVDEIFIKEE